MAEKEYIEREVLMNYPIRRDNYDKKNGNVNFINGVESVLEYAESLPTADVAPVRHGHWIECKYGLTFECSECKYTTEYNLTDFCPNCGAKLCRGE